MILWFARRAPLPAPLAATYLGCSNVQAGFGVALLEITNRSRRDYTLSVQTETVGNRGWEPMGRAVYRSGSGPQTSYEGWVGAHSNLVLQILAPEQGERFRLTYQPVPTKLENDVSWTLVSFGFRHVFAQPRDKALVVYPERN
jgi:hypothetical protein